MPARAPHSVNDWGNLNGAGSMQPHGTECWCRLVINWSAPPCVQVVHTHQPDGIYLGETDFWKKNSLEETSR